MKKSDVKNSIFLIGPMCVGKSLLAHELGEKLDMPVVSIDDLLAFVQWENSGLIGTSKQKQNKFISICNSDISGDVALKKNLKDKELKSAQLNRASEVLNIYKDYVKLLGNLSQFNSTIKTFERLESEKNKNIESIALYSVVSTILIQKIIDILNQPVIFDTPGQFGWNIDESKIGEEYNRRLQNSKFHIKLLQIKNMQTKILQSATTVFLQPGVDYDDRNSARKNQKNKILLKHIDNYIDNAKIMVTTNKFFNHPNNKYFKQRSWFDVKELATKEKLKDKCNISNVCDEIIMLRNELNSGRNIN